MAAPDVEVYALLGEQSLPRPLRRSIDNPACLQTRFPCPLPSLIVLFAKGKALERITFTATVTVALGGDLPARRLEGEMTAARPALCVQPR